MNQLSLNVIAISIFAMTLSVLLAPVLRIPEGVPATVILGVLSVATLDAVAWKSQGSTVFLDWLARFSPEHRDRVRHHEAGHFLVAAKLGFPISDYSLSAWQAWRKGHGGQGGVQFDVSALETELQAGQMSEQTLDRLCMVWMAGIAAEQIQYGQVQGGEDDRFALQQALLQLQLPPITIENKQRWATLQAKNLLEADRESYNKLLEAFAQKQSVEECYRLIN